MFEVYFMTWMGREEEAEETFETLEQAIEFCEMKEEQEPLSCEEGYIVMKEGKRVWG